MQRSIRVEDYFDNDDNGLWSWYLTNIRIGNFEELTGNKLKITLLRRFLNSHFDPATNTHHESNVKILFVSIPDKVHRDLLLLENFLRDYFHLEHLEHIQITKLTQSRVYNHENHYILIDRMNNFDDPSFLQFASSRWHQQPQITNDKLVDTDIHSNNATDRHPKLYGTVTEHSQTSSSPSSLSRSSFHAFNADQNERRHTPPPQSIEVKSIQSESTCGRFDSINGQLAPDEENDSIELNFPHSLLRKQIENKKLAAQQQQQQHAQPQQTQQVQQHVNNIYSPTESENVSINSFEESDRDESDAGEASNYPGQPLALTLTRNDDLTHGTYTSPDENVSELSSVSRSLHSLGSTNSLIDDDHVDESSDYSVLSILPSISITDALGHFRLVLQSSLLQNPETKEVYTAIRQSNNEPAVADVEDDWLLYDSHFSLDNLQMLTLQDLLDTNRSFPKIIFYSMIVVSDEQELQEAAVNKKNLSHIASPSQKPMPKTTIPKVDSDVSLSNEPQQFYALPGEEKYDDDDISLSDQSGPRMYEPTRMQSNATTAHRSIHTVNSIGDWAFVHDDHQNGKKAGQKDASVRFNADSGTSHRLEAQRTISRNGLSKVSTAASLNAVERSKSTPLPITFESFHGLDNEGKRWRDKVDKFRRKRSHKGRENQNSAGCTIM